MSSRREMEINLSIGADVVGRLLTGNCIPLESGFTAVETKLGWAVIGKEDSFWGRDSISTALSMHVRKVPLSELWKHETLGISDPGQMRGELDNFDLNEKIKLLPNGRYEIGVPWKCHSRILPDNKELVLERHEGMIKKLRTGGFLIDYQKVFQEWE